MKQPVKKHKFKLDKRDFNKHCIKVWGVRFNAFNYSGRCLICKKQDLWMENHIVGPLKILKITKL